MRKSTKIILLLGVLLVAYGYLSRKLDVYFFWDSKPFGWIVLFIALLFYLIDVHRARTKQGKKTIWAMVGIVVIIIGFSLTAFLIFDFHNSEPYQIAVDYLKNNSQLKDEVGNVTGFGLIPSGSMETTSINGSESGKATLFLTVFGGKKIKDVDVNLRKTTDTDWTVISIY